MKKFVVLVSVVVAMFLSVLGIRNVSANASVPSYCVVFEQPYDTDMRNRVYNLFEEKVTGDLMSRIDTENAMEDLQDTDGSVDLNKLGAREGVDYVVLLRVNNDTSYDDVLHNVKINVDVIEVGTKKVYTKSGNVIVPVMNNSNDEVMMALESLFDDEGNKELK